ncbi:MAG: DUF4157 domain-containing protein [Acidobacteriota bacterium]|nr:DUF4157 domain-containing protein [Acidobacteriota bacterium]MDH3528076.1 DUF4157 domain-containing protein [Acidobacteriota bacterium]
MRSNFRRTDCSKKALPSSVALSAGPTHIREATSSSGRPLERSTRRFFEPRLGYDLSGVRIHTGDSAAKSARAIDAKAYTLGRDIVFGSGEYNPHSRVGKTLLAHELAHTIQKGSYTGKIHRTPAGCTDAVPDGEQLYGGSESLGRRGVFLKDQAGSTDISTLSSFTSIGLRAHKDLVSQLREHKIGFDMDNPQDPQECASGRGFRFLYPGGNALGLEAVELCEKGEFVYFRFFCRNQSSAEKCSEMTPQQMLDSGLIDRAASERQMSELVKGIHGSAAGRNTTAIVMACDADENVFYFQAASSAPGQMPKAVRERAQALGVLVTDSQQTQLASKLVKTADGKETLRAKFGDESDQILLDLNSSDTPTKEAAQLKVYEAFGEYPNLHAEREAIWAIGDRGDKPVFVMPSREACPVCLQFISERDVILLGGQLAALSVSTSLCAINNDYE